MGKGDTRTCLTRDPVPWFTDCEPVVKSSAKTIKDVTRYCSYREQMFIPPPETEVSYFSKSKGKAWGRIGGNKEQCHETIEKNGAALLDSMTFCDSDLKALSGCCETVFSALTCVAETAAENGLWNNAQGSIFSILDK